MGDQEDDVSDPGSCLGSSLYRSVCKFEDDEVSEIRELSMVERSCQSQHVHSGLEKGEKLDSSSISIDIKSGPKTKGRGCGHNSGGSQMDIATVAQRPTRNVGRGKNIVNEGHSMKRVTVEVQSMEFQRISDIWHSKLGLWSKEEILTLNRSLKGSALDGMWKRLWTAACKDGVNLLTSSKEKIKVCVVKFVRINAKRLKRPQWLVSLIRRVFNYVYAETDLKNLLDSLLMELFMKQKVIEESKRGKKPKAVFPLFKMLVRIYQVFGDPEDYDEGMLRAIVVLLLCLVKIGRKADIFSIDQRKIVFAHGYTIIPMLKMKADKEAKGSISTVWETSSANLFNVLKLLRHYMDLTEKRVKRWIDKPGHVVKEMKDTGKKTFMDRAEIYENSIPIFFYTEDFVPNYFPWASSSYDSFFNEVILKEIKLSHDKLNCKITPGAAQKSARSMGKNHKYNTVVLDAIGGWKVKGVPQEFYEDFFTPEGFSDIVLCTPQWKALGKKFLKLEDLCKAPLWDDDDDIGSSLDHRAQPSQS